MAADEETVGAQGGAAAWPPRRGHGPSCRQVSTHTSGQISSRYLGAAEAQYGSVMQKQLPSSPHDYLYVFLPAYVRMCCIYDSY